MKAVNEWGAGKSGCIYKYWIFDGTTIESKWSRQGMAGGKRHGTSCWLMINGIPPDVSNEEVVLQSSA